MLAKLFTDSSKMGQSSLLKVLMNASNDVQKPPPLSQAARQHSGQALH